MRNCFPLFSTPQLSDPLDIIADCHFLEKIISDFSKFYLIIPIYYLFLVCNFNNETNITNNETQSNRDHGH